MRSLGRNVSSSVPSVIFSGCKWKVACWGFFFLSRNSVNLGDFLKRQVSYLPFDQDRIFERTFFKKWTFFGAGLSGAGLEKSGAGLEKSGAGLEKWIFF